MPSAKRTIRIERPVGDVFGFFSDPANDQKWRSHVLEISTAGPPAVGSRIHQVVAGPMGRGIPADIEVTAYDPPSTYAFEVVAGPVRPRGRFTFMAAGEGTDVTMELGAEIGGLKKLFLSGPVQKSMDGELAGLDRAKAVLEG